ncbi:hypothetical protein GTQ99_12425 [Kineococcus sp. T13]|uniref:hypothetical protein n=1 Tax=Kineococcus vitellinus TaxID=2696565 RepID=UPI0014133B64|nr:hypothetical protein [Kineococcus vitellinus]NAZ76211.1 hypothetical protein [Kineococcus vitellinus]
MEPALGATAQAGDDEAGDGASCDGDGDPAPLRRAVPECADSESSTSGCQVTRQWLALRREIDPPGFLVGAIAVAHLAE